MKISLAVVAVLFGVAVGQTCIGSAPTARLLGPELLQNPGFDDPTTCAPWYATDKEGFGLAPGSNPGGVFSGYAAQIVTAAERNCSLRTSAGISQFVVLNQTSPLPLYLSAWGKGMCVQGDEDADYSLYTDVTFTDNTTLWTQFAPFPIDGSCTDDGWWSPVDLTINENRTIQYFHVYLLFRNHFGTAYFDNISARQEAFNNYSLNENILTNPSFESDDCSLQGWSQRYTKSFCKLTTCSFSSDNGTGSLSTDPSNNFTTCQNFVVQTLCFNPPINNTLTFSAYVSIAANKAASYIGLQIFADVNTFAVTDIPLDQTDGFHRYSVKVTPSSPISSADVALIWDGDSSIVWDDTSLYLS